MRTTSFTLEIFARPFVEHSSSRAGVVPTVNTLRWVPFAWCINSAFFFCLVAPPRYPFVDAGSRHALVVTLKRTVKSLVSLLVLYNVLLPPPPRAVFSLGVRMSLVLIFFRLNFLSEQSSHSGARGYLFPHSSLHQLTSPFKSLPKAASRYSIQSPPVC